MVDSAPEPAFHHEGNPTNTEQKAGRLTPGYPLTEERCGPPSCPAKLPSRAAFTVSRPIPLLAPMTKSVATASMFLVGPARSRHVRCRQPHRKIGGVNAPGYAEIAVVRDISAMQLASQPSARLVCQNPGPSCVSPAPQLTREWSRLASIGPSQRDLSRYLKYMARARLSGPER